MQEKTIEANSFTDYKIEFDEQVISKSRRIDVFAWQDLSFIKPISEITQFPVTESFITVNQPGNYEEAVKAEISGTSVTVRGKLPSLTKEAFSLLVLTPNTVFEELTVDTVTKDHILTAYKSSANPSGNYSLSYNMSDSSPSGTYTVVIGGKSSPLQCTYKYFSQTDRNFVVNYVNSNSLISELKKIASLNQNGTDYAEVVASMGFYLDDYNSFSDDLKNEVWDNVIKNKSTAFSENSLVAALNESIALTAFNHAENTGKIEAFMNKYISITNLPVGEGSLYNTLRDYKTQIFDILLTNKPFSNIQAINSKFQSALLLVQINNASYSDIKKILADNQPGLALNQAAYEKYLAMSVIDQKSVDKLLVGKGFTDMEKLRAGFISAVNSISSQIPSGDYRPAGSGGGGQSIKLPKVEELPVTENTPVTPKLYFDDLNSVEWARTSIEYLASKGVINGDGTGNYYPDQNITREQFIKIMIEAFFNIEENPNCDFSDVKASEWYFPYIAAAQKIGISNGMGDGSFGVGLNIKREDMAQILYRTVQILGIGLTEANEAVTFLDSDKISGYAKEAVSKMQIFGIINGRDGKIFAPSDTATRAESAKMMYELIIREQ